MRMTRKHIAARLAEVYTAQLGGKVWCDYDSARRAYSIRGEGLPAHPDMQAQYPNGWSMLDYITPTEARVKIALPAARPHFKPPTATESRKIKPRGMQLLETAPVTWDKLVEGMTSAERQDAEQFLNGICQGAARMIGYLEARGTIGCGDGGHAAGVKASNKTVAKVRRALGFAQAKHDISF